ncbi:hypothetical protein CVIRNUC_002061 [Coccomyxa viridis]|uniref:Uncharacterized protein n=1 Tax=Coccomyxa viridis TaxID=1274662 RepID=A0AAV1HXS2_9CHLO|nr:hypothetical protein CVIRNUC_002061 [Coccomyxa viridis]
MEDSHIKANEVAARKAYTWAQCDRCSKWRQLSRELAESLGNDSSWFCENNPDPNFASCSQPQELSDDEIDKQLAGSEDEEPQVLLKRLRRPQVWQLIRENIYIHRKPKVQHEDEVMVCHCELPPDGGPACGPDCLNRVLNMECVPSYCNCGDRCSNQHFTKRQYVKLEKRRAGAKGFGLFSPEDLKAGQFIIEYIGEVLEEEEYLRRKEYYQESGQRHYYFMNIGNGEVIDAARKGALGRFINHSCRPNCETQKWVVRGELAIGLFASEDIPAGVELTFDYNFERYGDKPMRCLCGAKSCRGYIGGTGDAVAADEDMEDPEDASEDPEPIMINSAEAADPRLVSVLESEVGLAPEYWDAAVWQRLHQLAAKKNLEVDWVQGMQGQDTSNSSGDGATETAISLSRWRADGGTAQSAMSKARALSSAGREHKQQQDSAARSDTSAGDTLPMPPRKRFGQRASSVGDSERKLKVGGQPRRPVQGAKPWVMKGKKRSEVDRRLDTLVGPSGKLKDGSMAAVVGMLRLFNLCDVAPTITQADLPRPGRQGRAASPVPASAPAQERKPAGNGTADRASSPAVSPRRSASPSDSDSLSSGERLSDADGSAGDKAVETARRLDSKNSAAPGTNDRDSEDSKPKRERSSSREPVSRSERRYEQGLSERVRAVEQQTMKAELTGRQRARMADLSLLLDVILKTQVTSAKQAICKNGILHQLQVVHTRCVGPQYSVILKKMLRCVDHLPLTPNDIHTASSAHGSFGDVLHQLCRHTDLEVKGRAKALLDKQPLSKCSAEVQAAADKAQRERRSQGGRKRFASRYGGSWGDANGRTPRPHSTPFHNGGRTPGPGAWGRSMRTPQINGYEPTATPMYRNSNMMTPAIHGHESAHRDPSATPASYPAGPLATPLQGSGGMHRQWPASRLQNGNGPSMLSPAPAWGTPARRPAYPEYPPSSSAPSLPPGFGGAAATGTPRMPAAPPLLETSESAHMSAHGAERSALPPPPPLHASMPPPRFDLPRSSRDRVSRWEPEPGETGFIRRPSKWDSQETDLSADAYQHNAHRDTALFSGPPGSPVYYPGSVRIPNGDYPPPSLRIPNGEVPLGSARGSLGEDMPGLPTATPLRSMPSAGAGPGARPTSGSWRDSDGLAAALRRKHDSELADIFAAPAVAIAASWEDSWDDPGEPFEEWLRDCVMRAVRGYCQAGKPNSLRREESVQVYRKAVNVVLENERKAYKERQRQKAAKALDRRKLEPRIHDYVRETVDSTVEKRSTL